MVRTVWHLRRGHGKPAYDSPAGGRRSLRSSAMTVIVVVGASDAVGYGADDPAADAWPEVLRRTVVPAGTEVVNLGIAGATVAVALEHELPDAAATGATAALVWLSVNDLLSGVPAGEYEHQLAHLVRALRAGGSTRVLVGNTPPLDHLPLPPGPGRAPADGDTGPSLDGMVAAYNAAIDRVIATEGAELVDLHAVAMASRAAGTHDSLLGPDGFHPSTAGHQALADAFATVLALGRGRTGPNPA